MIEALGDKSSRFQVGDRVIAPIFFGGYSSKVCVPEDQVFSLPTPLSFAQGAALPVNYLTAYGMVTELARLKAEDTVLIHSAGGGVGLALLDLCRWKKAIPIALASTSKHDRLRERGVEHVFDPTTPAWKQAQQHFLDRGGIRVIFDSTGGESWKTSVGLLAPMGKLIAFGFSSHLNELSGGRPFQSCDDHTLWYSTDLFHLAQETISLAGFNLASLWKRSFSPLSRWMTDILELYSEGYLNITVDREFSFEEAAQAHEYLEHRKNFGKVVLVP
ncbi:alcohol dehydrogenase [bacterium]|nr:alcohol dehydrogenase [bacterium]